MFNKIRQWYYGRKTIIENPKIELVVRSHIGEWDGFTDCTIDAKFKWHRWQLESTHIPLHQEKLRAVSKYKHEGQEACELRTWQVFERNTAVLTGLARKAVAEYIAERKLWAQGIFTKPAPAPATPKITFNLYETA